MSGSNKYYAENQSKVGRQRPSRLGGTISILVGVSKGLPLNRDLGEIRKEGHAHVWRRVLQAEREANTVLLKLEYDCLLGEG